MFEQRKRSGKFKTTIMSNFTKRFEKRRTSTRFRQTSSSRKRSRASVAGTPNQIQPLQFVTV